MENRLARLGISTVCVLILLLVAGLAQADLTFFGWSDQHIKADGNGDHLTPAITAMNSLAGKPRSGRYHRMAFGRRPRHLPSPDHPYSAVSQLRYSG